MTSFIHQYRCYIQRLFKNQLDLDIDCAPQAPPTQVLELVAGLILVLLHSCLFEVLPVNT
jgi:hypothetical protein